MNGDVLTIFGISSLIIIIGSLASYLFKKTGLPDMIFLIILGIIFGPVLGFIHRDDVIGIAPIFATLALIVILLEGGTTLDIQRIFSQSPRATLLAIVSFVFSVFIVTLVTMAFLGLPVLNGLLIGSIIGGGSSIAIVSIAKIMKVREEGRILLNLESAITDVLCTVVALTLISVIVSGQYDLQLIVREISSKFTTGAVIGAILGVIWINLMRKVSREPYIYMSTLSIVLIGYVFSESLGGSGALSALLFGIVLGNERGIIRLLRRIELEPVFDKEMRRLGSEIAFLIKTFFFVYIGLIISIRSVTPIIFGVILSILLLIVRYLAVVVTTYKSPLSENRGFITFAFTRGLAAAVLAILVSQLGLSYANLIIDITFIVILTTSILSTIGIFSATRRIPTITKTNHYIPGAEENYN